MYRCCFLSFVLLQLVTSSGGLAVAPLEVAESTAQIGPSMTGQQNAFIVTTAPSPRLVDLRRRQDVDSVCGWVFTDGESESTRLHHYRTLNSSVALDIACESGIPCVTDTVMISADVFVHPLGQHQSLLSLTTLKMTFRAEPEFYAGRYK